jgi:hypothetical protein
MSSRGFSGGSETGRTLLAAVVNESICRASRSCDRSSLAAFSSIRSLSGMAAPYAPALAFPRHPVWMMSASDATRFARSSSSDHSL